MLPIGALDAVTMPEAFTTVLTAIWSTMTAAITQIKSEPLLLLAVGISFAGAVLGLAKGLMGARRKRK